MTLGERIRHYRQLRGLTQVQLAKAVNTSQPSIVAYEKDEAQPPLEKLKDICLTLKISSDLMIGLEPQEIAA